MKRETARLIGMELQLDNSARWQEVYFHGETMRPFLREGDELVVEPVSWRDVRPGEIVTYRDGDRFPTRRVVRLRPRKKLLVIKGDGLPQRRVFRVPQEDVIGRVVLRRRGSKVLTKGDLRWRLAAWRALLRSKLDFRYRRLKRALREGAARR